VGTRFRRVNTEEGDRTRFRVFLIHGRSRDWKKVKRFIERELRFEAIVSVEKFTGEPIIHKIQKTVWYECDCAVAILSADDLQRSRVRTARPNVLFEVGYCMGFFDHRYWMDEEINPIVLITEDMTALPSDLEGIERISYSRTHRRGIAKSFETLGNALNLIYSRVDDYFG
jgi:predicted nucleotide-binding protein